MTKNLEKYINPRVATAALVSLALFFGTMVRPCVRSFSLAADETDQIRSRIVEKYQNLRFAYRLAMQLRELHLKESALERQQKAMLRPAVGKRTRRATRSPAEASSPRNKKCRSDSLQSEPERPRENVLAVVPAASMAATGRTASVTTAAAEGPAGMTAAAERSASAVAMERAAAWWSAEAWAIHVRTRLARARCAEAG